MRSFHFLAQKIDRPHLSMLSPFAITGQFRIIYKNL